VTDGHRDGIGKHARALGAGGGVGQRRGEDGKQRRVMIMKGVVVGHRIRGGGSAGGPAGPQEDVQGAFGRLPERRANLADDGDKRDGDEEGEESEVFGASWRRLPGVGRWRSVHVVLSLPAWDTVPCRTGWAIGDTPPAVRVSIRIGIARPFAVLWR